MTDSRYSASMSSEELIYQTERIYAAESAAAERRKREGQQRGADTTAGRLAGPASRKPSPAETRSEQSSDLPEGRSPTAPINMRPRDKVAAAVRHLPVIQGPEIGQGRE